MGFRKSKRAPPATQFNIEMSVWNYCSCTTGRAIKKWSVEFKDGSRTERCSICDSVETHSAEAIACRINLRYHAHRTKRLTTDEDDLPPWES